MGKNETRPRSDIKSRLLVVASWVRQASKTVFDRAMPNGSLSGSGRVILVLAILYLSAASLTYTPKALAHRLPAAFVRGALCIHGYEGSWRDPNGPYYGGMQMDYAFMRAYGRRLLRLKGTADHWTPHEQLDVSYRAFRVRGWGPWPRSARLCGLRG